MNRVRKYVFDYQFIRNGLLDKVRLAQMVMQLPSDFSIVNWGYEPDKMVGYFIIESTDFDEVPSCSIVPEHVLVFSK